MRSLEETYDFVAISRWCREYHLYSGILPQRLPTRFLIAQYQIAQARAWTDTGPKFQNFAAAAMHFIMCGEELSLPLEEWVSMEFDEITRALDIRTVTGVPMSPDQLLDKTFWAAQQIVYGFHCLGSTRKSRYDPTRLGRLLAQLIDDMLRRIPRDRRAGCIHDEMIILTGELTGRNKRT